MSASKLRSSVSSSDEIGEAVPKTALTQRRTTAASEMASFVKDFASIGKVTGSVLSRAILRGTRKNLGSDPARACRRPLDTFRVELSATWRDTSAASESRCGRLALH